MVFSMQNGVPSAPIPGQGLTQPVGASPNQHPPQFVQLDDALNFTWKRLHNKKSLTQLILMLKTGMPVEVYARTIIYQGLLQNRWTPTLALLMVQTVIWQIEAIAKLKKIKVPTFVENKNHQNNMLAIGNMLDNKQKKDDNVDTMQNSSGNNKFNGFFGGNS
jgi:hypothetical protein